MFAVLIVGLGENEASIVCGFHRLFSPLGRCVDNHVQRLQVMADVAVQGLDSLAYLSMCA